MTGTPTYTRQIWRGAKIGAVTLGLLGFLTGISVCLAYHLPVPPLFVTEFGILFGGLLGGLAGYTACFPAGRTALWGMLVGAVLGIPGAALSQGGVPVWLAFLGMGTLLGYQAGCAPIGEGESGWRLSKG